MEEHGRSGDIAAGGAIQLLWVTVQRDIADHGPPEQAGHLAWTWVTESDCAGYAVGMSVWGNGYLAVAMAG